MGFIQHGDFTPNSNVKGFATNVAQCCPMLHYVSLYCLMLPNVALRFLMLPNVALCCLLLPNVALRCLMLPRGALCCTMFPNVALCYPMLRNVILCYPVLSNVVLCCQENITRCFHLPYWPSESTLSRIFLFFLQGLSRVFFIIGDHKRTVVQYCVVSKTI